MMTEEPTGPDVGDSDVIAGAGVTAKGEPLLATPTVTTTSPVVAPTGTTATIDVALQLVMEVASVPLNVTLLEFCVAPKFVPVIVTELPTVPDVGDSEVIDGAGVTANGEPLLATPAVTTTSPVVAPTGTTATIDVALQLVIEVASAPLKVTLLEPCVAPKFVPVIVTVEPTGPDVGDNDVIAGAGFT